jgi:hypothetical protein
MAAVTKTQASDEKPPSGGFFMKNEKNGHAVLRKKCYRLRNYSLKLVVR